jgi:molecular chaperone GrpE
MAQGPLRVRQAHVHSFCHQYKVPVVNEDTTPNEQPAAEQAAETPTPEQQIAQLTEALAATQTEMARHREEVLRARAEIDNARKRAQRDVEAAHKYGVERLIEALIPVKDSMDLGLDAARTATDISSLQEGMTLTAQMFQAALDKLSVVAVDPTGSRFDPEKHQAMMMEASSAAEPGTVLRVLQRGYTLHERVIRPAMVVVAKAPEGT